MRLSSILFASVLLGLAACSPKTGPAHELDIDVSKVGAPVQPTMYGVFFEDINFSADGGVYAEMIKNRSFEFPQPFMGWNTFGNVTLKNDGPFERNPHYVTLGYSGHREKRTGIENEGFFGVSVKEGSKYRFSVWARGENAKISVEIIKNSLDANYQALVKQDMDITSKDWKLYEMELTSPVTEPKAHLRIYLRSENPVDLEHVSLFPVDTWKGVKGGLRKDLVQALYDMHPGVIRFPGGCIVEGTDVKTRYQWKNTVGPVENRPLNENRWHYTFDYRLFPDYFQTAGLGFYEYFCLAEDLGAEPLPILNVGLICQYQNDEDQQIPISQLGEYIQDAVDLVEFANGPADSKWGKVRAEMGHPAPFNLKFMGIGNEQWGQLYTDRLEKFMAVMREKCPEIKIVGSAGPSPEGEDFDYLWDGMRKLGADLVDEHFYRNEEWFLSQGARYDNYDRKGPKVFAGEYACHAKHQMNGDEKVDMKRNHFNASLMEAAFMTGLERNADVVYMATYAPLFAHAEGWQWRPDLIWYDNLRSVKSCSYYVQQLYSLNKGTNVIPLTMDSKAVSGQEGQDGLFASAVVDNNSKEVIVKVVNTSDSDQALALCFTMADGQKLSDGTVTAFHSDDLNAENTLDNPETVIPVESSKSISGNRLEDVIKARTFLLYKFPLK